MDSSDLMVEFNSSTALPIVSSHNSSGALMRKTAAVCCIPSCVWFIKRRHTRAKINVVFTGYIYSARTENSTRQFDYTMRLEQFLLQKLNLSTAHWTYWQYVGRIVFCNMLWVIVYLHVCSIVWWVLWHLADSEQRAEPCSLSSSCFVQQSHHH